MEGPLQCDYTGEGAARQEALFDEATTYSWNDIGMELLRDIFGQLGWVDVLDIGLVSAVFYALITWLRRSIPRTAVRRILFAAPVAVVAYILIRLLDLYVLESVVRALFIVFVIIAVVVFQADLRRMFDRVVSRSRRRRAQTVGSGDTVDRITEAVVKMTESGMGALLAVVGREPLDSVIDGGIELDGRLTQPLLFSIFDPDTPGHDGAVLIENDRVVKFAAHLPLAAAVPDVSKYGGTRHSAALGLAEVSDAFVIVVSEERRTISIAHERTLREDVDPQTLKSELGAFWNEHYGTSDEDRPAWWQRLNLRMAAVAVLLAVLIWMVGVYSPNTVTRRLVVPIEIHNLPDDWAMESDVPTTAEVVVSGPEQLFVRLNPTDLAISIDASDPEEGVYEVVFTEADLNLPAGINLDRVDPQVLQVEMQPLTSVTVPVAVRTAGMLPDSLLLVGLRAEPDSVPIMIPRDDASTQHQVYTQAVDLTSVAGDSSITRRLVFPDVARLPPETSEEVVVVLDVRGTDGE